MGFENRENLARPHRAPIKSLLSLGAAVAAGMLVAAPSADATLITLIDDNSSVTFDTQSQAGAFDWNIDGQDVLEKQWFWYRVGPVGPEQSIDTIPQTFVGTTDSNFDGDPDVLFVRYVQAGLFRLETRYSLDGGAPGSGVSDIGEQLSITNLSGAPLDFHFFQYVDLDLSVADTVFFPNANTVDQFGLFGTASEAVNTPVPFAREAHVFPITIGKLNDGLATVLDGTPAAGPGDVTWGYQWDFVIAPGDTAIISKDKLVTIPEPGSMALLAAAAGAAMLRRRRRIG